MPAVILLLVAILLVLCFGAHTVMMAFGIYFLCEFLFNITKFLVKKTATAVVFTIAFIYGVVFGTVDGIVKSLKVAK